MILKRKTKLLFTLIGILIISFIFYYALFVLISKDFFKNSCSKYYCLDLLNFNDFFTVILSIAGLYFVIDSLDSWKDQAAYSNSKDILYKLHNIIYECDILSIHEINQYVSRTENTIVNKKNRNYILSFIPINAINSPIDQIHSQIKYMPIHFHTEFTLLIKEIRVVITNMNNVIEKEEKNYINIDSKIHKAIRNEMPKIKKRYYEINDRVSKISKS